jgi:hypothetical protein
MDFLRKGLLKVETGVKKQHTIQRIDVKNVLRPRAAFPTDTGIDPFILDGRTGIVRAVEAYREFNPALLEESAVAPQLADRLLAERVPATLESRMMAAFLGRAGEKFELTTGQGSLAYANGAVPDTDDRYQIQWWDGFVNLFVNDPLVRRASISQVALTNSNIDDAMDNLIQVASLYKPGLIQDPATSGMKFIMSQNTLQLYLQYQSTTLTFKGANIEESAAIPWKGYPVVSCVGMPDDTVLFVKANDTEESNLWMFMNSQNDFTAQIGYVQNNSQVMFMKATFKMCVQYGWSDEVFLYTTKTAADFKP